MSTESGPGQRHPDADVFAREARANRFWWRLLRSFWRLGGKSLFYRDGSGWGAEGGGPSFCAGAKTSFEKAVSSVASKRAASYDLARTLELAGNKADAKRAYQQYVKLYPGGPWAKAAETAASKL